MSKLIFVTYASGTYKKNIFWNKFFVNLFIRPDISLFYTDEDLKKSNIYKNNRELFDAPIGAGYWAWKPWVISKAINNANEGDIVIYQDCGAGFKYKNFRKPNNIIDYAKKNNIMPGVLIPIHGKNKHLTHAKCFELMECNNEIYYNASMIEATVSAWKVGKESKIFVNKWLTYCLDLRIVGDSLDRQKGIDDTFLLHRYDQSILTNLSIKMEMKPINLSFNDMHLSKSLSLIDLDLGNRQIILNILLSIIRFFRKI